MCAKTLVCDGIFDLASDLKCWRRSLWLPLLRKCILSSREPFYQTHPETVQGVASSDAPSKVSCGDRPPHPLGLGALDTEATLIATVHQAPAKTTTFVLQHDCFVVKQPQENIFAKKLKTTCEGL